MKVDISAKVIILDNQQLSDTIDKYEGVSRQVAYLFMSKSTMKALNELLSIKNPASRIGIGEPDLHMDINTDDYIISKYEGRNVFLNDDLDFGEIEIR